MRSRTRIAALSLPLVFAAVLVVGAPWAAPEQAAAVPDEIPEEARKVKNPQEATPQSVANGKQIYGSQCAMCHGATGDGKGELAARFGYTMPDFSDQATQKAATDGELFWVLSRGHGKMSGEGDRLSDHTRWDLVNYIRTLGRP